MSKKENLEKDYKNFNSKIEQEAEEELKKIQQESDKLKAEAIKAGETVERNIKKDQPAKQAKAIKKKVNT